MTDINNKIDLLINSTLTNKIIKVKQDIDKEEKLKMENNISNEIDILNKKILEINNKIKSKTEYN